MHTSPAALAPATTSTVDTLIADYCDRRDDLAAVAIDLGAAVRDLATVADREVLAAERSGRGAAAGLYRAAAAALRNAIGAARRLPQGWGSNGYRVAMHQQAVEAAIRAACEAIDAAQAAEGYQFTAAQAEAELRARLAAENCRRF